MNNREIDALVAEHVIKMTVIKNDEDESNLYDVDICSYDGMFYTEVPHYSTDIAAAYEVMTKMYDYGIRIDTAGGRVDRWSVRFPEYKVRVLDESLPMAICLVALKLKGVEVDGL